MQSVNRTRSALAALCLSLLSAPAAGAQEVPDSSRHPRVTVAPGPQYRAGALERVLLGSGWRDVWTTPATVPVLDMEGHAGGLRLEKRGGGFHSRVLHLTQADGWREYRFRSVDKFPMQGLPPALQGTDAGRLLHDQIVSVLFPAAPLLVPPLLAAIGVLHVEPELYVMGDSPRLEAQRDTFAGMLGTFELKAQEAPDDQPGFAGSRKIKGAEKFLEDLAESREHRPDEREFLAVRLIDFLVNDSDRSLDNYDFARFGEDGAYVWRPIPIDRDQAFIDARGLLNALVLRRAYPKQLEFEPAFNLKGLTYTGHPLDRRILQRLSRDDFRDVAHRVQRALTDSVIATAVMRLPESWRARTTADERIASVLRARRDQLPAVAMRFYHILAGEVDVRGTQEPDRFEVVRHDDGRVTVTVGDPARETRLIAERRPDGSVVTVSEGAIAGTGDETPYYRRTFVPGETKEVRLYAGAGDDVAVVRGVASDAIRVRIIGGPGDDVLADSAGGRNTTLYDSDGENRLLAASGTRVDTRPWKELTPRTGFRIGEDWRPDWGRSSGWRPAVDYNTGSGILLGAGRRITSYGFRRLPYHWRAGATLLVGTGDGRLGLTGELDYRFENVPRGFRLEARATQLEATRFFGYGNDTPALGRSLSLVDQQVFAVEPSLVWFVGWRAREHEGNKLRGTDSLRYAGLRPLVGELHAGPVFGWIDPDPRPGSPLATSRARGAESFGLAGVQAGLELDRTNDEPIPTAGWTLRAGMAGYPAVLGLDDAFGILSTRATTYVPLVPGGAHLAFRAGASVAAGTPPVQFAPAIGGRSTLRGHSWRRFTGDRGVNGSAELRVPVGTVNVLVRSQVGLFGLADAGRVWFDGRSDGGWHAGLGGGIWLSALGQAVSVAYVRGERGRVYVSSGTFY